MIKEILIKALSVCGYKLSKEKNFASFSNFKNLAKGYEQMLYESGNILETNEILGNLVCIHLVLAAL